MHTHLLAKGSVLSQAEFRDAEALGLNRIEIEENRFDDAWLKGVRPYDILIVVMECSSECRLVEEDGVYFPLMQGLRRFSNVFVLTVGLRNAQKLSELEKSAVVSFSWDSLGVQLRELLAKIELDMLRRQVGKPAVQPSVDSRTIFYFGVMFVALLLAIWMQVDVCKGTPSSRTQFTLFKGDLHVPTSLQRPLCNTTEILSLIQTRIPAMIDLARHSLQTINWSSNEALNQLGLTVVNFTHWMEEARACEIAHSKYVYATNEFYTKASSLKVERGTTIPTKCLVLGQKEFEFPKFIGAWL